MELRDRKCGSCGLCSSWVFEGGDWGRCAKVNENSDVRGAVLSGVDVELSVRKDFGCRLFQEIDIFRN